MSDPSPWRRPRGRRRTLSSLSLLTLVAVAAVIGLTATSATARTANRVTLRPAISQNVDLLGRAVAKPDYYGPAIRLKPSAAQLRIVRGLHAHVAWNEYGTPESLIRYGSTLSSGLHGSAVEVARSFVLAHRALFRLTGAAVRGLTVLNDSKLRWSSAHVVLFRQSFGGLPAGQSGLITVGVRGGAVYYVSSSAAGMERLTNHVTLSAQQAWLRAAASVGRPVAASGVQLEKRLGSWTRLSAPGFAQVQQVRLRAFPTVQNGARAAYETVVEDVQGGQALAYTVYVDAQTGAILFRHNDVDQLVGDTTPPSNGTFTGSFTATGCSKPQPLPTASSNKTIVVAANADQPENDIALNLLDPAGKVVASSDEATSPEAVDYTFPSAPPSKAPFYTAQVCPSPNPLGPFVAPFSFHGTYSASDQSAPSVTTAVPQWSFFTNSPPLDYSSKDTRVTGCWKIPPRDGGAKPQHRCDLAVNSPAARAPWDYSFTTGTPTFSTFGNAAQTREAWASPLTPGPSPTGPVEPLDADRTYGWNDTTSTPPGETWTNSWYTSKCDPTSIQNPAANDADVLASEENLFAGHNRMHDWSYALGFTEQNYNLQQSNFGNTTSGPYPAGKEADPELGDVQAGAVDGGFPEYLGRDNANQITLNDGTPGITNQYLFQPIAGAFYSPCVDGSYDMEVFGHEYTHAISNRMIGGPDDSITGAQGGAMGESWSDQDALEYLHEYGYFLPGETQWAEGPYVTGNNKVGIRNYALNHDPLNYSDIGYDIPGPEVHADGEIWSAVGYALRQGLVRRWNAKYPARVRWIQRSCANGRRAPITCPGNRRWIQDVYDGFLLMPGAVSMLDARDAYLAADVMRYGKNPAKNDQAAMWHAFATHGFGINARTVDTDDTQPQPGFVSPLQRSARLTFEVLDGKKPVTDAKLYVGRYEARVTPVADTNPKTKWLPSTVRFAPGRYQLVIESPELGLHRATVTAKAGEKARVVLRAGVDWASLATGASADGKDAKACAAKSPAAACGLIDATEGTDWTVTTSSNVNASHPSITVQFAHPHAIDYAVVSAMLEPGQSRFQALRQFRLDACRSNCDQASSFHTVYTSPAAAFPAGLPRPLAPGLIFRGFKTPKFTASSVRLVVLNNECTGAPAYQDPKGTMNNDPTNPTDCPTGSTEGQTVSVAELELFTPAGSGPARVSVHRLRKK